MSKKVSDTIIMNFYDGVLEIKLNRPKQLNAFNDEMHKAFHAALKLAHEDEKIRAVLITGEGRGFCAGQDLGDRNPDTMTKDPDLEHTIKKYYIPSVRLIRSVAKPVICAVNGVAAGAGANLAFCCDIILAADSAIFIQSFSKVGLVPDAGGSWLLPKLIGEARAKALTLLAEPLTAKKAEEWGLVFKVVSSTELMQEARKITITLASGPTFAFGMTKKAIHIAATNALDDHIFLEAKYQGEAGRNFDYSEGVRAFLQKRSPKFKGKANLKPNKTTLDLWSNDEASVWLGLKLENVTHGSAKMSLLVKNTIVMDIISAMGGIFSLADSCFAFAVNSFGGLHVGQHNVISYLRPVFEGNQLFAFARQINQSKNTGIYDVDVKNQDGKICAEMRGFSKLIKQD